MSEEEYRVKRKRYVAETVVKPIVRETVEYGYRDAGVKRRVVGETVGKRITGPFGIWPFPVLNVLLQFIQALKAVRETVYPTRRKRLTVYEVVRDEKGRIMEITEHETEEAYY